MTKAILLIIAGFTIGTAAVALPTRDLGPPAPAASAAVESTPAPLPSRCP